MANSRKIKENQYDFPDTNPISPEAKDLITSLLHHNPDNRPSIDEIADHKFFHSGDLPRDIPSSALDCAPTWDPISKPMSELNWRFLSVQTGLGKDVRVGGEAGKSVQACIAVNEHPLKGTVARLREEQDAAVKENVLPTTLSPRVPAPAIGGLEEVRAKASRRNLRKALLAEEDKENEVPKVGTGTLKRKGHVAKKRPSVKEVFDGIPEVGEEPVKARRMAPPERKPSGNVLKSSTSQIPAPTSSGNVEPSPTEMLASGAKRTLRGAKSTESVARSTVKSETNGPTRGAQPLRTALKRTTGQDNLRQVITFSVSL